MPVHDDRKQFEFLTLESAQAGLSWLVVLRKREAYRQAFADFDPEKVARFTAKRIEKLLADPGIIRNRLKITAAITNARQFLDVQEEFGTFDKYIWGFVDGRPIQNRLRANEGHAGHVERIRRAEQGPQAARLQIRRQHDHLRPHAGRRHGQRPPGDVLSAQGRRAAEMNRRSRRDAIYVALAEMRSLRRSTSRRSPASPAGRSRARQPVHGGRPCSIAASRLLGQRQGRAAIGDAGGVDRFEAAAQLGRVGSS